MQTSHKISKEEFYESPNNWQDNSAQCLKLVCSKCGKESLLIENGYVVCKECGDGLYEMLNNKREIIGIPIDLCDYPTVTIGTTNEEH